MKKRIYKFAAIVLAMVACLAIVSTVGAAASRATHSTTASSYSANGYAVAIPVMRIELQPQCV